jgi:membrane-bound lytic murein transglycosylase D
MTRIYLFILSLFLLASCAQLKTESSKADKSNAAQAGYARSATLEKDDFGHRIKGSSTITEKNKPGVYFLYGAEHLNLKNYYFDIPVVYNDSVKKWINYFLGRGRGFFIRYSERAGRYAPICGSILEQHGLPRDLIFLAMAESGFQNHAKSWARAVGPWQFMPYTGKKFGLKINWYVDERRDPIKSTIAASKYLSQLYNLFGSWELAASAYNAGEGKIGRAIRRYKTDNFWHLTQGRYLRRETKDYIPKIMSLAIIGKNLESFGLQDIAFNEPLDFEEIIIPPKTDLVALSEGIEVDYEEMQRLNPELLRWFTPPDRSDYILRLPVGKKVVWDRIPDKSAFIATKFQRYHTRSLASADAIAKKFKIKSHVIADLNEVPPGTSFQKGRAVILPFREGHSLTSLMYSDLYELPPKAVRSKRKYRDDIKRAIAQGSEVVNPTEYYTVQKGDTLWDVSKKTRVPISTIIKSNLKLIQGRMIRAGDTLVVR